MQKIGEHMLDALYFDLSRYVIAAGLLTVLLLVFKRWANNRRIQTKSAKRGDYIREILSSTRTVIVFGITTISTLVLREYGIIQFSLDSVSVGLIAFQFAVIVVAHDAYFYWMHRTLHHKRLFLATHAHHHKSRTPTPWTAYSFATWEAVFEAAFMPLFLLVTSLMGIAYAGWALFFFLWHMIFRNVMAHAGVELFPAGWVDSKWTDWISTTTHHDLHHQAGNSNFGFYFTWWDRMMGTENPRYKEEFRRVAKPIVMSGRPAELASVAAMTMFTTFATLGGGVGLMVA
ncbi:sterol desaturase family protein [Altererythrobacter aestiaquae]|uniref:Sterol desaturase family protein n=2 Tax=Pontixanthobacter aestiaquae TaxID=1509367 RepID=A0A844ZDY3_9SPHN|nr:sterol desaturase family protein [Pontixanthobacter aestiaquae]